MDSKVLNEVAPQIGKPIRIAAAITAGACLLTVVAGAIVWAIICFKRGKTFAPDLGLVAALPFMAAFLRVFYYIGKHGRIPEQQGWPFASLRLLNLYLIVYITAMYCRS